MKRNSCIDIMKGLAIISVLFAHSNSNNTNYQHIMNVIGLFGVPVFFFVAGFLFKDRTIKDIILRKKKILFKWLISGTIIYLYVYLRKYELSISTYFNFLLGTNSYLYFLSCYFIIICMMHFVIKINNSYFTYIVFFLSVIFLLNTDIVFLGSIRPISFYCFFYLGYWFNKYKNFFNFFNINSYLRIMCSFVLVILIIMINLPVSYVSYYGLEGMITGLLGILLIYNFSFCIDKYGRFSKMLVVSIGKVSFDIYLWHMLFMGFVNKIFIKPFICIMITYLFIIIMHKLKMIFLKWRGNSL